MSGTHSKAVSSFLEDTKKVTQLINNLGMSFDLALEQDDTKALIYNLETIESVATVTVFPTM